MFNLNFTICQTENSKQEKAADQSSMTKKLGQDVKNEEQPAKVTTTFDNDQQLHKLFTSDTDINTVKQLLGPATIFHIFSDQTEISADTNGNIVTKILLNGPEFGTRGESQNHTTRDVYYIGSIDQIGANAFRTGNNYVVLGDDSNVKFNGDQVFINGNRLDHLKKADVHVVKGYLNIDNELNSLRNTSGILASLPNDSKVIVDFGDMNNRIIDVSHATDNLIIINIDASSLEQPQPITIKGLSSNRDGAAVILNVCGAKETINWQTQTKLVYDDGTQVGPGESHNKPNHVLWNFGNATQFININSGYLMGSVLAPNSEITANVNADGNLIGKKVNIKGGESHRWDFWAPEFVVPVFPHGNNDFVYLPHNGQSTTPGKATTPVKPTTPKKATTPVQPTDPSKPTSPVQPSTPVVPTPQPSNPKVTTPVEPTTPEKATTPVQPTDPSKPTSPVQPSTPVVPTLQPSNPAVPTPPTTPVDPTTPDMPNTNTPKIPIVPSVPENKEQRKVNLTPGTSAVFETSNSGLPKTGSVQSKLSQITGLLLLAILATFGFAVCKIKLEK